MLTWFSYLLCVGAVITNFITPLEQTSARFHSFPPLHLKLLPSFLMPPSPWLPLFSSTDRLFFVASRPFLPRYCDPFSLITLWAEKTNIIYKQFYCPSQSLYLIRSLKAKTESFQRISSMNSVLTFVNLCIAVFWFFVTFYWIGFLLWNCTLWFIKLQYFSYTVLPPVICDHSDMCCQSTRRCNFITSVYSAFHYLYLQEFLMQASLTVEFCLYMSICQLPSSPLSNVWIYYY